MGLGECGSEREGERGRERKQGDASLTPDGEHHLPLEVPVGEGGDVAGVAALVRVLGAGDEQGRVHRGGPALEPHPARVAPEL